VLGNDRPVRQCRGSRWRRRAHRTVTGVVQDEFYRIARREWRWELFGRPGVDAIARPPALKLKNDDAFAIVTLTSAVGGSPAGNSRPSHHERRCPPRRSSCRHQALEVGRGEQHGVAGGYQQSDAT
jgi:hypothetical protein